MDIGQFKSQNLEKKTPTKTSFIKNAKMKIKEIKNSILSSSESSSRNFVLFLVAIAGVIAAEEKLREVLTIEFNFDKVI